MHSLSLSLSLSLFHQLLHTGIDSQLAHTSDLLGRLHDEQKDRLSQEPVKLDDGHLVLPGPSDEEMKLASELRAGLVQLTAQVWH